MRGYQDAIGQSGGTVAAVGLGEMRHARAFLEETGLDFPLLVDEQRAAYRALGLRRGSLLQVLAPFNRSARSKARQAGFRQHRTGKNPFQLGGSFVFGPGDVDLFLHSSSTFGDNAHPEKLLEAVR
ncbi:MAG: peroxiredoxin-like family protein, partial [Acidobacteriota bacterium]